jgi:uncharacterized protein YuzE
MKLTYHSADDLLYIEFDAEAEHVRNEDAAEGVVLDITEDGHIAGIEILDASRVLNLDGLMPVKYETSPVTGSN